VQINETASGTYRTSAFSRIKTCIRPFVIINDRQ